MSEANPLAGLPDRANHVSSLTDLIGVAALFDAARVAVQADSNEANRQFWIHQCGMPDNLTFEEGRNWAQKAQAKRNAEELARAKQIADYEKLIESRCQQHMIAAGFSVEELQGIQLPNLPRFVSAADPRMPAFKAAMKEREQDEMAMAHALGWAPGQNQVAPTTILPDSRTPADERTKSSRPGGRPQVDDETAEREVELHRLWQRARDSGRYKPDFAKENGMSVKEFQDLLNRVAARLRRKR